MPLKGLVIALVLAGMVTWFALAGPPSGKDRVRGSAASIVTVTVTTTSASGGLTLCHPTRSKTHPYVKIVVPTAAVWAHVKKGDVLPGPNGACPTERRRPARHH